MHQYFAVFGNPVAHSLSPLIHHEFARQAKQDIVYKKILVPTDKFIETFNLFANEGGVGANVTVPCKIAAFKFAKEVSPRARAAHAVNTLHRISDSNTWYGDNTDGIGLVKDLMRLKVNFKGSRILILGAGGAARGIIEPLKDTNPKNLAIANRTHEKAQEIALNFSIEAIKLMALKRDKFDIIINATSASLEQKKIEINHEIFENVSLAYDLAYAKDDTSFIREAKKFGALTCIDGMGMLIYQAAEAFFLWTAYKPDVMPLLKKIKQYI